MLRSTSNLYNRSMQRTSTLFSRMKNRVDFGPRYTSKEDERGVGEKNVTATIKANDWLFVEKCAGILAVFFVICLAYYLCKSIGYNCWRCPNGSKLHLTNR